MTTTSDLAAERRALTTGAALVDRSGAGRLRLGGADRARFLHGLVTCDVKDLAEGRGAYGFVTSPQGRVLADVVVLALEDELWLEVPPGADERVADHLAKYLIADRVEIAALPAVPLAVAGPRAAELLAGLLGRGALPDEPWSHRAASPAGVPARLVRRGVAPVDTFDLWLPPGTGPELRAHLQAAGAAPVGDAAWDLLRVERGVPAFGRDFGADNFPQETGLGDQAVSYTKGCYLGQEIVARIHYRGGVHKALRGLRFRGVEAPPPSGTPLLADGRAAGTVGTTAVSPDHGAIGLAILHERANAPGTVLQIEGGGEAEVVELPFG
ncbi:MAG TPA: glycine cleavage T C-terminal barrel domain-containing protein [Thermoanaerobaculia bacterium]